MTLERPLAERVLGTCLGNENALSGTFAKKKKRMMGLEPTTFCMASGSCVVSGASC